MKSNITPEGILLRIERLRQGKEQKEICTGICAVSTLSKIETGRQSADPVMLEKLYGQLGIRYTSDAVIIGRLRELVDEFFEQFTYQYRLTALDALRQEKETLRYSPLAADWLVICALADENNEALSILGQCQDYLNRRQKGWYLLALSYAGGADSVESARESTLLLQNSFARTLLLYAYYAAGEYRQILLESEQTASQALQEGNLWALAECYNMRGTVYACFNMEDMMLTEYKRAARLLSETRWQDTLQMIFYNIGATYLCTGRFDEAEIYLGKAAGADAETGQAPSPQSEEKSVSISRFFLLHKLALLHCRTGRNALAAEELAAMEALVSTARDNGSQDIRERILALTSLELSGRTDSDDYLSRLEELMETFSRRRMFGYMMFYHNQLRQLYTRRRLYRKAFLLEQRFSDIQRNSSL